MARTKAFDPTSALDRALALFWCRGYSATTLQELLEQMGISRQSLYDTYGDKHQLFLAALDRYCDVHATVPLRPLREGGPLREALGAVLRGLIAEAAQGEQRGCFLVNCAIECAPHDADVATRVAAGVRATEDLFATALRHAQQTGEIVAHHSPELLARYLVTAMQGLRVQAKALPDPLVLEPVIELVLAGLE
jgi:TetR/AcrR family transcriptional repressor of nem operon